jgi:large subunit ribosomal protein L32
MGLPGHRRTSSDKRRRAAHFALKKKTLASCQKCKSPVLPHVACKECGTYAGRQVLTLDNPLKAKKSAKKSEKSEKKTG